MHMVRVHVVHTSIIIVVVDVVVVVVAAHTLHTSMQSAIYARNQVLAIYFRVVYRCWLFYGRIFFFSLISSYTIFRRIYVYMHHTSHFFSVLCVGNFYFRHLLVLKCIHFCGTARCAQHDWVRAANASVRAHSLIAKANNNNNIFQIMKKQKQRTNKIEEQNVRKANKVNQNIANTTTQQQLKKKRNV